MKPGDRGKGKGEGVVRIVKSLLYLRGMQKLILEFVIGFRGIFKVPGCLILLCAFDS